MDTVKKKLTTSKFDILSSEAQRNEQNDTFTKYKAMFSCL